MTRFEKCWGIYTGKGLPRNIQSQLTQAILEPNLFPYKYPNISQT